MPDRLAALVPAAGLGVRLGRGPKAFLRVGGRSLLAWSVAALEPWVDEVVVAVPGDSLDEARRMLADDRSTAAARVIVGGVDRQATVRRLLDATTADIVVVHDAARPFLDAATIRSVLTAVAVHGACSVGVDVADTLVRAADGAPVDRSGLKAVQTPQAFRRDLLARAHARAEALGETATDEAGLVRRTGVAVAWVAGGAHLHKVTTAADLTWAEAWAAGRRALDG